MAVAHVAAGAATMMSAQRRQHARLCEWDCSGCHSAPEREWDARACRLACPASCLALALLHNGRGACVVQLKQARGCPEFQRKAQHYVVECALEGLAVFLAVPENNPGSLSERERSGVGLLRQCGELCVQACSLGFWEKIGCWLGSAALSYRLDLAWPARHFLHVTFAVWPLMQALHAL